MVRISFSLLEFDLPAVDLIHAQSESPRFPYSIQEQDSFDLSGELAGCSVIMRV